MGLEEALTRGCEPLGVALSSAQRGLLLDYLAQLNKWNSAINLTAIRDPHEQLAAHLLDCLAIVPVLEPQLTKGAVVLDVGSGGGLPGVVLAIMAPDIEVHCVDAVAKKTAFITQVRGALRLTNLHAHHSRVESLQPERDLPAPTLIVARAFSTLAQLIALTQNLLSPQGRWAAMKGVRPDEELSALPPSIKTLAVDRLIVPGLAAERHLVQLAKA
ncbi:MAG TPA: 16S rRNA (guanine(527)-N(7))-methyltransferase RsmG [Burkholderiaceae bacterium]|nr:16S rRNA (guanine(527)-N(7))-methyltransferase RsmG [Burkholderiaceae bacterium]